jgi:hypothetical protein
MIATHIMLMVITVIFLHLMYRPLSSFLLGGDLVAVTTRAVLPYYLSISLGLCVCDHSPWHLL